MSNTVTRGTRGNPASQPHPVRHDRQDMASLYTRTGARKYLNTDERQRLLAGLSTLPAEKALFVRLLVWTGARVSEVLALRPSCFQIKPGLVTFRTLKRRQHSMREVPIPPDLMITLATHFAFAEAQPDPDIADRRLWTWDRVTAWRTVKRLMATAGVVGTPACPRGLRHGFGVGTLQAGVPINLVQRWLGHARISTTAIYAAASGPEELVFARRFWDEVPQTGPTSSLQPPHPSVTPHQCIRPVIHLTQGGTDDTGQDRR